MRNVYAGVIACAALCACAQAEPPPKVGATPSAQRQGAPALPAIVDAEPDVTREVSEMLGRVAGGTFAQDRLTDNARAALSAAAMQSMRAALKPCGAAPALELLRRTTKGEDRQYLYRAPCAGNALLIEIDFNKGAKINRLVVRPQSHPAG